MPLKALHCANQQQRDRTMPKQAVTTTALPERAPGESDREYERRLMAFINGDDVRTKTDLAGFKTADFHFAPERD